MLDYIPGHILEAHLFPICDRLSLLNLKKVNKYFYYLLPTDGSKLSINLWRLNKYEIYDFSLLTGKVENFNLEMQLITSKKRTCQVCDASQARVYWTIRGRFCIECAKNECVESSYIQEAFGISWQQIHSLPGEAIGTKWKNYYPKKMLIKVVKKKWNIPEDLYIPTYIDLKRKINQIKQFKLELLCEKNKRELVAEERRKKKEIDDFRCMSIPEKRVYRKQKMIEHLKLNTHCGVTEADLPSLNSFSKFLRGTTFNINLWYWQYKFKTEKKDNTKVKK